MKAEDLMIGDWVSLNGSNYQVQDILKKGVIKLYENTKYGEHTLELTTDYIEDFIEPIPLTTEILEKNGFRLMTSGSDYIPYYTDTEFYEIQKDYSVCLEYGGGLVKLVCLYESYTNSIESSWVTLLKYTHELQHALKLCGIDKEIIL